MMKKYLETKDEYPDCILFYRLGDFYEMFFDDALLASRILDIALTGKACGLEERAPMCGVPYHSASSYLTRLVEAGYKVAIGEQVEDPATAKGLVKREVVKIVTPGTLLEDDSLEKSSNNYLMAIYCQGHEVSIAYVDISTGELNASLLDLDKVKNEVAKILPREVLSNSPDLLGSLGSLSDMANIYLNEDFDTSLLDKTIITKQFEQSYLDQLGLDRDNLIMYSLAIVLNYISKTQMMHESNLNTINIYQSGDYMALDLFTRINLELTKTIRTSKKKGSLLQVLDATSTPMGARMLKKHIEQPLINKDIIDHRLNITQEIKEDYILRDELKTSLSSIFDLERICAKIAYDRVSPKDLVNLKNSLEVLPYITDTISNSKAYVLKTFIEDLDCLRDIYMLIRDSIKDEPATGTKDGNIIREAYSDELDQLRDISNNGAFMIRDIEQREREKTGAKSLKIGYNKVFGYFFEVSKAQVDKVPAYFIRKQTTVNAERYITPDLKEFEIKILSAKEKIVSLEQQLYQDLRNQIKGVIKKVQETARALAELDVLASLATVAYESNYICPNIVMNGQINIRDGRHPVIEKFLKREVFVPNDVVLNHDDEEFMLITGPNMAGKSTYMRQVAILMIMAQIGSFIPAREATISPVDRVFTRVGASDDISTGQSTFMVEMKEVAYILENATSKSLIILDEIGRGTSTFDGLSIAQAVVEHICKHIHAKTLFATHYHELIPLEDVYPRLKNYTVAVKEKGKDIAFLRRIIRGGADRSYGIHVAKLAGLPAQVLKRAEVILESLEEQNPDTDDLNNRVMTAESTIKYAKPSIDTDGFSNLFTHSVVDSLLAIDVNTMTPIEALNAIHQLQAEARNGGGK